MGFGESETTTHCPARLQRDIDICDVVEVSYLQCPEKNYEQDWNDGGVGFEWVRYVHWPRELEEGMHRVMDLVRLDFAVRTLNPVCMSDGTHVKRKGLTHQVVRGRLRAAVKTLVPDPDNELV